MGVIGDAFEAIINAMPGQGQQQETPQATPPATQQAPEPTQQSQDPPAPETATQQAPEELTPEMQARLERLVEERVKAQQPAAPQSRPAANAGTPPAGGGGTQGFSHGLPFDYKDLEAGKVPQEAINKAWEDGSLQRFIANYPQ